VKRPVVVGSGPAGIFAGLVLAEAGLKPIIIEQGKNVDEREKDVYNFFNSPKSSYAKKLLNCTILKKLPNNRFYTGED